MTGGGEGTIMFMCGGGVLTCVSLVVVVVATKVVLHPLLAIDEKVVVCQVRQKGGHRGDAVSAAQQERGINTVL